MKFDLRHFYCNVESLFEIYMYVYVTFGYIDYHGQIVQIRHTYYD